MRAIDISVVVPVYNTPVATLRECVMSVLKIRDMTYEIIIVNDGSTRQLSDAYESFVNALDASVVKYAYQQNQGVSAARNHGIGKASGKYVLFLDADDSIIANNLNIQYSADIVIFDYIRVKGRKREIIELSRAVLGEEDVNEALIWSVMTGIIGPCRHLYKREYLIKHNIHFDVGYNLGEDILFNFFYAIHFPTVECVNKPLYCYNYSSETSRNRWKCIPDVLMDNETERFGCFTGYLPKLFPYSCEEKLQKLTTMRIDSIYRSGIEMVCTVQATKARRSKVEKLMKNIALPKEACRKTRTQYMDIVRGRWIKIIVVAAFRMGYLFLSGV